MRQQRALLELLRLIRTEYSSWRIEHRQGLASRQAEIKDQEDSASQIRIFQPVVIPGLIQLPDYARCILRLANVTNQKDLDEGVSARLKRQTLLYDSKKTFQFVITEAALLSRFCPVEVVIQQLQFIRVIQQLPNVTLGLLPHSVALPTLPQTAFVSYDSNIVIIETSSGTLTLTDERDVQLYSNMFSSFLDCAVKGEEAQQLLSDCADKLRSFRIAA